MRARATGGMNIVVGGQWLVVSKSGIIYTIVRGGAAGGIRGWRLGSAGWPLTTNL
jgi:hypothetical protein